MAHRGAGQIEGIGTSPRLSRQGCSRRSDCGRKTWIPLCAMDTKPRGSCIVAAIEVWRRTVLGLAIGLFTAGPIWSQSVVTRQILLSFRNSFPLPRSSAIQPRSHRCCLRTVAGRAAGRLFRYELSSRPRSRRTHPASARNSQAGLQRYGFHGLSYEYIASVLPSRARDRQSRVIVAHLGSGASLCALKDGRAWIARWVLRPWMDYAWERGRARLILALCCISSRAGLSAKEVEDILYKKSGLLGISGISNDMRDLLARVNPSPSGSGLLRLSRGEGNRSSGRSARRSRWTGLYSGNRRKLAGNPPANLRGVGLAGFGLDAGQQLNGARISTERSKVSAWVIPTNEELMIARHTGHYLDWISPS